MFCRLVKNYLLQETDRVNHFPSLVHFAKAQSLSSVNETLKTTEPIFTVKTIIIIIVVVTNAFKISMISELK